MRYSFISAAILALASSVFAQTANFDAITSPTQDQNVPAGTSLDIVWQPSTNYTGTISITLLEGATPSTLSLGPLISAGVDQTLGKFTWAIPTNFPSFATYGFKISLDSDPTIFQYSFPFHITGLSGSASTSSATGSATSTTTVQLGTGPAYTSTSSSSSATITSSSSLNSTVTTASSTTSSKSSSNITLSTTLSKTSTPTTTSSTSSGLPTQSKSAAVGKAATGGLAMIGGLVLAFAL